MSERPCLRDIGILAHIDAGKTSLTERLLYVSGRIREAGDIDEGTTATDYLEVERERGITVKAAAANLDWALPGSASGGAEGERVRINLIDTPGHVDFSSEVERSLRALDGALVLLCGVAGVQSRTETIYRACARRGVSRLVFVNKMDRRGASFDRALGDLRRILDPGAMALQIPWGEGELFRGVVDLVEMRAYDFSVADERREGRPDASSLRPASLPIPVELEDAALRGRSELVEALADRLMDGPETSGASSGSRLLEDFVAGVEPEPGELRAAIRSAVLAGRAAPVLCGSAFSEGAACLLLDAVAEYLPAPGQVRRPEGRDPATGALRQPRPDDPFSGFVFKTGSDPALGRLSWTRIWSGAAVAGDRVLDASQGKQVRITRIFGIQADKLESLDRASEGDIVALALGGGASDRGSQGGFGATGSTLCDPRRPVLYESLGFAAPVVSLALEPKTREDGERLKRGAALLVEEDPSLRLGEDPLTGLLELSGMGELHLEVAVERLERDFGVRLRTGAPRVAYRETLAKAASAKEEVDRDLGGMRARASVCLRVEPGEEGGGIAVIAEASMRVSSTYLAAAKRGAEAALSVGPSAGFSLDCARVVLSSLAAPGGSVSSGSDKATERAIEIAASLAAASALRAAGSFVVEPVMRVELSVPASFLGAAAAVVTARGGRIESIDDAPLESRVVTAAAPLRSLFGFASELRSATEGRAEYSARFSRYERVPPGFSDFH